MAIEEVLVGNLNEDGYLQLGVSEAAELVGVSLERVEEVLTAKIGMREEDAFLDRETLVQSEVGYSSEHRCERPCPPALRRRAARRERRRQRRR